MKEEALNKKGKELFSGFKALKSFYLAGGTALALQIGHRVSIDFDFFSNDYLEKDLLSSLQKVFLEKEIRPSVNNSEELTVFIGGVKVTFLRYPFPPLEDFIFYKDIPLLNIKEIAASKAYTIGRRGSYKDYVDLYFVVRGKHASISEIISLAEKKYKKEFNSRLFIEQLVYFEDIEDEEISFLKKPVGRKELERFFLKRIKELKI